MSEIRESESVVLQQGGPYLGARDLAPVARLSCRILKNDLVANSRHVRRLTQLLAYHTLLYILALEHV